MEFKVNYTLVGLFTVVLVGILIGIGVWLSGPSYGNYQSYLVYLDEAVSGLSVKAPVKFNGVEVGYVANIQLNPSNPQQVQLLLNIEKGTPITISTVATLMAQGVTGITYIGLKAAQPHAPVLLPEPGMRYPIIKSEPSFLVQLDTAIRETANNLSQISTTFQQVFSAKNQASIQAILENVATFTQMLSANSQSMQDSVQASKVFLQNSAQASLTFTKTLSTINQAAQRLSAATKTAQATLNDSHTGIQALSQQAIPNMIEAINHLNSLFGNLQQLSNTIENNPAVIIRGKKPAPLGPGEQ